MSSLLAPRLWGAHVLGVAAVVVASLLGYWQLESWEAARAAEARDLSGVAPVPLAEVMGPDDAFPGQDVGRPVQIEGTWVPDATLYVSGRAHDGEDGFWAVTPLAVGGADAAALPVVRGWVADPADAPPAPTGDAEIVGYLQPGEGTGEMDPDPGDDVLPQLRIADVIQHVDQDLYGAYAVARDGIGGLPPGDLEELPEVGAFTGLRNLLYALEWWLFAAFAAFIWWRYVRDATSEDPSGGGGSGAPAQPPVASLP